MPRTRRSAGRRASMRRAARISDAAFRRAIDASADGIHIVDPETLRLVDVNETACRFLGYTREEFLQLRIPEFSPSSDPAVLRRTYAELFAGSDVAQRQRITHRHRDGRIFPIEIHRRGVMIGRRRLVVNVVRDVTEQARAENALRASEARFRSLANLSSDWYWEQDVEYRFTRIEGRNISPQAPTLIGQRRWETGLEAEGGWEEHRALLEARKPFFDVLMWRTTSEGTRFMLVSGEPVFAPEGAFAGYRGVGRDVTKQKRAEQLLRLEHQIARALSESGDGAAGLRSVLQAVCETEGWGCGRYFAVDEATGEARFHAGWSTPDPGFEAFVAGSRELIFRPGDGLVGKVLQTGDPIWTADTGSDPRVLARQLALRAGTRGAFVFAVTAEGRRIGVLSFSSRTLRKPDQRLVQAARVIGGLVGQFLQRMRAEAALRESEARFRSLTELSSDFYWETDEAHRFVQISHGASFPERFSSAALGKAAWEVPYTTPDEQGWAQLRALFDARQPIRDFEYGRPGPGGSAPRYFTVSAQPRHDAAGRFLGYRGIGREITDLVLARERVASLAYRDALTGLANRTSLVPAFEQAIERARRRNVRLAALFIDLDGFKQVNDAHGHPSGDRFLEEIGRRLRSGLRASDLVARLGGDEFFAVLEDVQGAEQVEAVARKLLSEIARPVELAGGPSAAVTGSIGISIFPDDAPDVTTLMKYADRSMYEAKQAGKNALRFHSDNQPSYAKTRSA